MKGGGISCGEKRTEAAHGIALAEKLNSNQRYMIKRENQCHVLFYCRDIGLQVMRAGIPSADIKVPMNSPTSNPMSFWMEQDVLEYIYCNHIPIERALPYLGELSRRVIGRLQDMTDEEFVQLELREVD